MGRGKHQASLDLVEASYGILEEIQPATVRAVCYRLFVTKIIPDMRTASTARVSRQLTWARENDHIPWEWIVDETRTPERVASWDDPKSFMRSVKRCYRKDLWREQPHDVEVWSEKGTVRGTLGPVLEEYGVTFRVQHGFASATSLHEAAGDSQWRPFTVLYVGDHDPSGMHMSEVDLPVRLERYEADIDVVRIELISNDLSGLPHFDLVQEGRQAARLVQGPVWRSLLGTRCDEPGRPAGAGRGRDPQPHQLVDMGAFAQGGGGRDRDHRYRHQ